MSFLQNIDHQGPFDCWIWFLSCLIIDSWRLVCEWEEDWSRISVRAMGVWWRNVAYWIFSVVRVVLVDGLNWMWKVELVWVAWREWESRGFLCRMLEVFGWDYWERRKLEERSPFGRNEANRISNCWGGILKSDDLEKVFKVLRESWECQLTFCLRRNDETLTHLLLLRMTIDGTDRSIGEISDCLNLFSR